MILSFRTLQNYITISGAQFCKLYTDLNKLGFEVNSLCNQLDNELFVVGLVKKVHKHHNAKKLLVCQVEVKHRKVLQIVCGSSRVEVNQFVIVALPGAILVNGQKIGCQNIREVVSTGMICAANELDKWQPSTMLDSANEIYIISNDDGKYSVGDCALPILGLDDIIIDYDATYNLHCQLGIYQIAQMIANEYNLPIKAYIESTKQPCNSSTNFIITNKVTQFCPNSAWVVVNNVTVDESPRWIIQILHSYGIKAISPIVDIANLIMLEINQPLHSYDRDVIADNEVIFCRQAKTSKQHVDMINYPLTNCADRYVVVTKKKHTVLGLLGVVGANYGKITSSTHNIIVEASNITAHLMRQEIIKTGINTQASQIFSKPLPEANIKLALERFLFLGHKLKYFSDHSAILFTRTLNTKVKIFNLSLPIINRMLGIRLSKKIVNKILISQFKLVWTSATTVSVIVPANRMDIDNTNSLMEVLMKTRVVNELLNNSNPTVTQQKLQYPVGSGNQFEGRRWIYSLKCQLKFQYFNELKLFSLGTRIADPLPIYSLANSPLVIENPLNDNNIQYREQLFYAFIPVVVQNWNKNLLHTNFFEISEIYAWTSNNTIQRQLHLCITHGGPTCYSFKGFEKFNYSLEHLRDCLYRTLHALEVPIDNLQVVKTIVKNCWINQHNFHYIFFKEERIGFIGEINANKLVTAKKIRKLYVMEIKLEPLLSSLAVTNSPIVNYHHSHRINFRSKLQEHFLTFTVASDIYNIQIKRAIAIILASYHSVLWKILIVDSFASQVHIKNGERAVTVKLCFDLGDQKVDRKQIETLLWEIKRKMEKIICKN